MKVQILACWFATSYGAYTNFLRAALEKKIGEVGLLASNCGCGDPAELNREFVNDRCEFVELGQLMYFKDANPVKAAVRTAVRGALSWERARRYMARTHGAEVLHFQQTLNAFGFSVVSSWLNKPTTAKRIVTIHELDPQQRDFPELNAVYNRADHLIVLFEEMKQELVRLGLAAERISVVPHGVDIRPIGDAPREGVLFYGGHFIGKGKGTDALLKAMRIVRTTLGDRTPVLKIHGHWGRTAPADGLRMAEEAGVADRVVWLNQLNPDETIDAYRRSLVCVMPYQGSSAGLAAVHSMAYGVPVIATRRAGLPDHLGDVGTWVSENAPEEIAAKLLELLGNEALRGDIAARGRARAEREFHWDTIAARTLEIYRKAMEAR